MAIKNTFWPTIGINVNNKRNRMTGNLVFKASILIRRSGPFGSAVAVQLGK